MRTLHLILALFVSLAPLAAAEPPAIPDTPVGQQLRWALGVLAGDEPGPMEDRFAPSFIEQVPGPVFAAAIMQLRVMGPFTLAEVRAESAHRLTAFVYAETVRTPQSIHLAVEPETALIEGFLVRPAPAYGLDPPASWDEIDAPLAALHGLATLGVYELADGELRAIHERDADRTLPLGSTFKLWVLGALAEYIDSTDATWDDQLAVRAELKSLASGGMQNEPDGAQFTVAHFADQMISISDNTATDHLLNFVGRERVEDYMARFVHDADRNRPFLSTREMFSLKLGADAKLLAEYAAADTDRRRTLLADLPDPSKIIASAWLYPVEVERIEWFATPRELAATFADLHRLEPDHPQLANALRLNPGIPFDRDIWPEIAYKGGSEPGVLNMSWMVRRRDDRWFIVSVGWTDPAAPVDINELIMLATRVFQLLETE